MFLKINDNLTINLYNVKRYWYTYRGTGTGGPDNKGIIKFEFMNGTTETVEFDTLAQAKDCMLNIQGRLDRKFFDLNGNK